MRRTLSMITLAAFAVMLLGSCSKINERLDNLEKKVDGLENEKIASIESQITGINSSISDLGAIRSNIQSLTDNAKSQGQDITDLQAADKALGKRIEELSKYVGDTLKAYATEEWARATFSTLGQYEKTCDTIAKIDARIGALDENLSKKIADCADSLTTWINGQFEAYYTAAEMDAKTDAMQAEIDSARAANLITDAKADSLAVELAKVQPAIDSAKAQLTREYTAAIDTAIKTCEGNLTKQIQDEIEKVNETVTALAQRVGILEFQVKDLLGRVGALEGMIQSVTIVPAYSDGSVKVENDSLHIDCIITPASATRWLGIRNFTILVKGVAGTKAGVETIRIASPWDLKIDWTRGTASIKVKIADKLPGNDSTLAVALNVKYRHSGNLTSDYTTEFVPVMVIHPVSVRLDKHSIVAPYRTSDSTVILKPTVKNAKDNSVTWTSTEHCTFVDGTGKVTINANAMGKDTIVVTTVEGDATDTCFVTILPKGAMAGEFSVSADKKVLFSQGNLVATIDASDNPTDWKFAANQYDYIGEGGANKTIGATAGDVDLFGWSTSNNGGTLTTDKYGINTSISSSDYSGDFYDWGKAIGDGNTWRTLYTAEWQYLFSYDRSGSGGQNYDNDTRRGKYKYGVTVCGKENCVVLLPDNWDETVIPLANFATQNTYDENSTPKWSEMQAAGAVCLPAAGYRYGSNVYYVGNNGGYWSSSAGDEGSAYRVSFSSSNVNPGGTDGRYYGYSVRLITEVK